MGTKRLTRRSPQKASRQGRRRKAERPQEILDAAFEEFAASGYAAARLEDVAKRGGIAKGTIYLYFKNKERLFRAVVRSLIHPVFEKLGAFVGSFSGSAEELLRELLSRHYAQVVRNEKARAILRLLIAESGKFPQLSDIFHREIIDPGVAALRQVVEKGVASGEFRKGRVRDFPQILIAPGVLAILWVLILGERHRLDLDAYMTAHTEFVLCGLRKNDVARASRPQSGGHPAPAGVGARSSHHSGQNACATSRNGGEHS
jgi:AcrR family transcriptional regulator